MPILGAIIDAAPLLPYDPYGTVTVTTSVGQRDNELPDSLGFTSILTGSTFSVTGEPDPPAPNEAENGQRPLARPGGIDDQAGAVADSNREAPSRDATVD